MRESVLSDAGYFKGKSLGYNQEWRGEFSKKLETDGLSTNPEEYLKKFGEYDVSEITDSNYYYPTFGGTKDSMVDKMLNQGKNTKFQYNLH